MLEATRAYVRRADSISEPRHEGENIMYMQFRNMRADMGKMQDAIGVATWARDRLNSDHGGDYTVSVNIGGDPSAITLAGTSASMGDYERLRASVAVDDGLQSVVRLASSLILETRDTITQVLRPPGDRSAIVTVNRAMMHMPAVAEAIPFALEVSDFVKAKLGSDLGVMTAVTGNRAGLAWMGFSDSLDQASQDQQALETDPDWLAFFTRSEHLFVPGTLEQALWQLLP